MEKRNGETSKEHDLSLVRSRRRRRGAVLRQDLSRYVRRRGAPRTWRFPSGKKGDVLTVEFVVMGVPCLGLNGGPAFKHNEAFSFQVATTDQAETDRYWNAIVGNGGQESACGWCKDKWGLSWQITPVALTQAITDRDPAAAKRAFDAMMEMKKIDIAAIEAALRG
jgi:2-polyprenyl-6-hydroxyphenyl methylase/3-demethylubiquinone-9 3-methyltransferase